MKTRYDIGQKVWFLNVFTDQPDSDTVVQITAVADGIVYELDNGLALPECSVFSARETLREHYALMFK